MAFPTAVNSQVTDSVVQAKVGVVGSAPVVAVGMLYQTTMHALTLSMHDAVLAQQQMNITSQAATARSVRAVLGLTASATADEQPSPSPEG